MTAEPASSGPVRPVEGLEPLGAIGGKGPEAAEALTGPHEEHWCGCCGREIGAGTRTDPEWCADCKPHLRRGPLFAPWQRTYFAQHGKDCPWQVGE